MPGSLDMPWLARRFLLVKGCSSLICRTARITFIEEPVTTPVEPRPNSAVRILIVDDHVAIRLGLRSEVESNPLWKVCGEAENGKEAIEKVLELKPVLVILDISMPIMNGIEACRQIRRLVPDIKILLYTTHSSPQLQLELIARQAGADSVLNKSQTVSSLKTTVDRILRDRLR
jgi:DNA-binding NarL/FixJ family response regulator